MTADAQDRPSWLSHEAYLAAFAADADLLSSTARPLDPGTAVPTCPGWTVLDLVRHVGDVYSHKVSVLRLGRRPEPGEWALGDGLALDEALDRHDRVRGELSRLLAELGPDGACWTWMEGAGEGTTGAWARRMAHEALVHRVDVEAAAGRPLGVAAAGLAEDGVGEVLTWMADDPDLLDEPAARVGASGSVHLDWGGGGWLVDVPDGGYRARPVGADVAADAVLRGDALSLDLWVWGRMASLPPGVRGDLDAVLSSGDAAVLERLRARLALATG
jgi:uncharacterized protein (TIGR03083 family)